MYFPAVCKIEKACSSDLTRPGLASPYLDLQSPSQPMLVATDGYILVALPVVVEPGDKPGMVPAGAILLARKFKNRQPKQADGSREEPRSIIRCEARQCVVSTPDGEVSFPRPEAAFPEHWRQVVPRPGMNFPVKEMCFNPYLLVRIMDACGLSGSRACVGAGLQFSPEGVSVKTVPGAVAGITLRFTDCLSPIRVDSLPHGAEGAVMPMRL